MKGKVKWSNSQDVLITGEDGKEYAARGASLMDDVKEGDNVIFNIKERGRRVMAVDVRIDHSV